MLNKPKFMIPSTNMQECVIDVNTEKVEIIPFSCIVDGNESIHAWRIRIYQLSDNTMIYDTGKVVLSSPFYPIDSKNRNVVFNIDLIKYPSIMETVLQNDDAAYYWTIEFWNKNDNENEPVDDNGEFIATTKSCEEVFYANSLPDVTVQYSVDGTSYISLMNDDETTAVLSSKGYFFKATYKQNEGISLKRYGWQLTDMDSGQILIDTISVNQIYGTSDNIICSYDGFLNNGNYSIRVYIETQNSAVLTTEPIVFSVSYPTTQLDSDFKVEALKNESGIISDWSKAVIIGGTAHGYIDYKENYPVTGNNSVNIPQGASVVYDYGSNSELNISEMSYVVLSTQILSKDNMIIFSADGTDENGNSVFRKLTFESGNFVYTIIDTNGVVVEKTYTPAYSPNRYVWYVVTMSPFLGENGIDTTLTVVEKRAINGLYPSSDLYPSTDLYPSFGEWEE